MRLRGRYTPPRAKKVYFFIYPVLGLPDNLEMTANFFNVNKHIIKYRLNTGKSFILPFAGFWRERSLL